MAPAGNDDIPDYEELAIFETEIAEKVAPKGVMRGTTAAACAARSEKGACSASAPIQKRRQAWIHLLKQPFAGRPSTVLAGLARLPPRWQTQRPNSSVQLSRISVRTRRAGE